jgi:hypothetical protein
MLEGIKGDERTLIERVQPYAATNIPSDDPLAILRKLSNRDKHRLLVPMIAALRETGSWVASDNAEIRFTYLARGPVEDDTKIVSFTATPEDPSKDMKCIRIPDLRYRSATQESSASLSHPSISSA